MRTLTEIKTSLEETFMANEQVQKAYGFAAGTTFSKHFSRISIESLWLYIAAYAAWVTERLFEDHTAEVETYINAMKPHTLRWYQEKAKAFLYGVPLIDGTDQYDTAGMTDRDLDKARIVKFAAVTEAENATLYVKVASQTAAGNPKPLTDAQLAAFKAYLGEYKDAGVRADVISTTGDFINIVLTIRYNPMLLNADGENTQGDKPVELAVKRYIENLPFNGEYRNNDLLNAVMQAEGVVMAQINSATQSLDGTHYTAIDAYATPYAGYFLYSRSKNTLKVNYIPYNAYTHED